MFDIVALGELLIDFTEEGHNARGIPLFARNPGGAPANVLAMHAKLGGNAALIGKVGDDTFGHYLRDTVSSAGVDTSGLILDARYHTTLAFVQLDESGDRSFSFYRKMGADAMLDTSDIRKELLENARLFHFGSVSMTEEPSCSATLHAAEYAKSKGCLVSFDPNYREPLWDTPERAAKAIRGALAPVDILKVSLEEMTLITGETDLHAGAKAISALCPVALILISLGAQGAFYHTAKHEGVVATYNTKTIDTNGAGDAFMGAVLYQLRSMDRTMIEELTKDELEQIIAFGNAAGSLTTERHGAISAMPDAEAIEHCMRNVPLL